MNALDGVAGGAYLTVDLKAATEAGAVVGGDESEVIPGVGGGVEDLVVAFDGGGGEGVGQGGGGGGGQGKGLLLLGELSMRR